MIKILNGQAVQHKNAMKPKSKPLNLPKKQIQPNNSNEKIALPHSKSSLLRHRYSHSNQNIAELLNDFEVKLPMKFRKSQQKSRRGPQEDSHNNIGTPNQLLCLDENLESLMTKSVPVRKPASAMSRYGMNLEVIEERVVSEEDIDPGTEELNGVQQCHSAQKQKDNQLQATTVETKTKKKPRMLYDPIVRPFIEPTKTKISVIQLLKSRRKKMPRSCATSKLNATK